MYKFTVVLLKLHINLFFCNIWGLKKTELVFCYFDLFRQINLQMNSNKVFIIICENCSSQNETNVILLPNHVPRKSHFWKLKIILKWSLNCFMALCHFRLPDLLTSCPASMVAPHTDTHTHTQTHTEQSLLLDKWQLIAFINTCTWENRLLLGIVFL